MSEKPLTTDDDLHRLPTDEDLNRRPFDASVEKTEGCTALFAHATRKLVE